MLKRFLIFLLILTAPCAFADSRPNILLIVADDQRCDDMNADVMPLTQSRIFDQGMNFSKAYVTTPACCPSRSSIFTGMYASKHKVIGNRYELHVKTFAQRLHKNGYYTGLVGKYLNTWKGTPRKEFDYWASFPGGSASYTDFKLNVNGAWSKPAGYITHVLRDHVLDFLELSESKNKPFLLIFTPNAPHHPYTPDAESSGLFNDAAPISPSFNEADVSDKPAYVKSRALLQGGKEEYNISIIRNQRRALWSLDLAIGEILQSLEDSGRLDSTLVIYISDNGLLRGEHRLGSKDAPYEEAAKVPFAMRYPARITPGNSSQLVSNIDIAPTIYDLADVDAPSNIDGISLVALLNSEITGRSELLLEDWRRQGHVRYPWAGLVSGNYKFIRNSGDIDELYDLNIDPFELVNRSGQAQYQSIQDQLSSKLVEILLDVRGSTSFSKPKGKLGEGKFSDD